MIINKFIKYKDNKYKVVINDSEVILYDDTILKYNLLVNKNIDESLYSEILDYNDELKYYYLASKYITKKLRSELEIRNYLSKYVSSVDVINRIVDMLFKNNLINEELFAKSFIDDRLYLSNDGKEKIRLKLLEYGISNNIIFEYLDSIDDEIWINRIKKYIDKKIKTNHTSSKNQLKSKILIDLTNLGYDNELVLSLLDSYVIIDEDIKKKEYLKIKKSLEKKYSGEILEYKIKERLYRKGFKDFEGDYYEE